MRQRVALRSMLVPFALFSALAAPAGRAEACLRFPIPVVAHPTWIEQDPFDPFEFSVTFHDLETIRKELKGLGGCGVGLILSLDAQGRPVARTSSIAAITQVTVIDTTRQAPLAGLSFSPNTTTGGDFYPSLTLGIPDSEGYFSAVTEDIPGELPVELKIAVRLKAGKSVNDLIADLENFLVVGFDEAALDGHLTGTARSYVRATSVMFGPPMQPVLVPTLSRWGSGVLVLLLLILGAAVIRSRSWSKTAYFS